MIKKFRAKLCYRVLDKHEKLALRVREDEDPESIRAYFANQRQKVKEYYS